MSPPARKFYQGRFTPEMAIKPTHPRFTIRANKQQTPIYDIIYAFIALCKSLFRLLSNSEVGAQSGLRSVTGFIAPHRPPPMGDTIPIPEPGGPGHRITILHTHNLGACFFAAHWGRFAVRRATPSITITQHHCVNARVK